MTPEQRRAELAEAQASGDPVAVHMAAAALRESLRLEEFLVPGTGRMTISPRLAARARPHTLSAKQLRQRSIAGKASGAKRHRLAGLGHEAVGAFEDVMTGGPDDKKSGSYLQRARAKNKGESVGDLKKADKAKWEQRQRYVGQESPGDPRMTRADAWIKRHDTPDLVKQNMDRGMKAESSDKAWTKAMGRKPAHLPKGYPPGTQLDDLDALDRAANRRSGYPTPRNAPFVPRHPVRSVERKAQTARENWRREDAWDEGSPGDPRREPTADYVKRMRRKMRGGSSTGIDRIALDNAEAALGRAVGGPDRWRSYDRRKRAGKSPTGQERRGPGGDRRNRPTPKSNRAGTWANEVKRKKRK